LASSSPRRKKLLESIGITFTVVPSNIDEKPNPRLGAAAQAKRLSFQKGSFVAEKHKGKDIVVISADTIVLCDGEQMGKPEDHNDAMRMLKKLSGKKQAVVTGFTVFDCMSGRYITKSVQTLLWTRKLSDEEIASYLKKENVFDKAGAYAIQGIGELLFEWVEGDYSNVLGLPLTPLYKELKKFGVSLL
ncbi:MAG: Maf family protein, partial [bacterium]|nr:Maf family protein [bacterium]